MTKNDFLNNNDIENTYNAVILYTSTRSYTNIVSSKMRCELFLYKRMKFISIKRNDEYDYECRY